MSRSFDAYFKPREIRGFAFRKRVPLVEDASNSITAYNEIWNPAYEHFLSLKDQNVDLPPDSSARLYVEGILGILKQHEIDKSDDGISNFDIRKTITSLIDSMEELRGASSEDTNDYVDRFITGMRDLHNRVDSDDSAEIDGDDVEGGTNDVGGEDENKDDADKPSDEEDDASEEEEEQDDSPEALSKALGLS